MSFSPGTICVPNEANTDGGAIISSSDGTVLTPNVTMGTGDVGAVLSNGIFCIGDKGATSHLTSIPIYNPSLSLRGTAVPFTPSSSWTVRTGMTSDYVATFYASIVNGGSQNLVRAFSDTGVTGGTTWHISTGGALLLCLSQDGSTFFYSPYGISASAISKWDLGSDTSAGTLVAGVAGTDFGADLLRLPGTNNLLVIAQTAGPVFTVRRYDESGTLLKSYVLTGVTHEASASRLSIDLETSTAFWVRTFDDISSTTTKFWKFDVSSGALLDSFTVPTDSDNPSKVPFSCPFFAWGPLPNQNNFVGTSQTRELVRVRQVGLPALPGNVTQFIGRAEVQMQPGLGVPADPTQAPTVQMAWSGDNAVTFNTAQPLSLGRTGAYYTPCAYKHVVGSLRQPAVKLITCSDDVTFRADGISLSRAKKAQWLMAANPIPPNVVPDQESGAARATVSVVGTGLVRLVSGDLEGRESLGRGWSNRVDSIQRQRRAGRRRESAVGQRQAHRVDSKHHGRKCASAEAIAWCLHRWNLARPTRKSTSAITSQTATTFPRTRILR